MRRSHCSNMGVSFLSYFLSSLPMHLFISFFLCPPRWHLVSCFLVFGWNLYTSTRQWTQGPSLGSKKKEGKNQKKGKDRKDTPEFGQLLLPYFICRLVDLTSRLIISGDRLLLLHSLGLLFLGKPAALYRKDHMAEY